MAKEKSAKKKARGTDTRVRLTVRLERGDWERLHQLAVMESCSMQDLAVEGFSLVFENRGMPKISGDQ